MKTNEKQTPLFNENYKSEEIFDEEYIKKEEKNLKIEELLEIPNFDSEYKVFPFAVLNGHESKIAAIKEITYDFTPSFCCGKKKKKNLNFVIKKFLLMEV